MEKQIIQQDSMLENCEKLSVVSFEPIEVELPNIDPKKLSTDQKYLFDICNGISRGNIFIFYKTMFICK